MARLWLGETNKPKCMRIRVFCGQHDLLSVLQQPVSVDVGKGDVTREQLLASHTPDTVQKSYELWNLLVQKIVYAPIMAADAS